MVYDALGLGPVAIKFHRIGGRSFSSARLNREYMPEDGHCPWLIASKKSAEREYLALTTLHPAVSVPLPVDQNRHTVVMSLVSGQNLNRCRLDAAGRSASTRSWKMFRRPTRPASSTLTFPSIIS